MNKKILGSAIVMAFAAAGASTSAQAALANGSTLNFDAGVTTCTYYGVCSVKAGSYFGMDTNGNGAIIPSERTAIAQNNGLILGTAQAASGSHAGIVNGSESPGIDAPWEFFGSTGMHFTSTPANVLSASGSTATVDFSGWNVTWNGIPAINMGSGAWNPISGTAPGPYYNGVANVVCGVDCGDGDTYTLDYSATVPLYDPSGFGAVHFFWHLEGTVSAVPVPAAFWLFGSGLLGLLGVARSRK